MSGPGCLPGGRWLIVKRALGWVAAIALLGAVGAGGFYGINRLVEEQEEPEAVVKPELVAVALERGDLVDVETFDGQLRYRDQSLVYAASGGVVTWLPEQGSKIDRGEQLLELNGAPVVLMFGERPAWRPLLEGIDEGPDVEQLEENLAALGFTADDSLVVDAEYTEETTNSVEEWQADLGLPEDGAVELGRVIFERGEVRVGRLLTEVGATVGPGTPLFEISGTEREIVVALDLNRQDLVSEGGAATIVLPDDTETPGTITSISNVAVVDPQTGRQTIEMTIAFDNSEAGATFEQAAVDIEVVSEEVLDALLAPVEAVLALAEGGYALEVVEGDSTRLVAVELGKFADGLVAISGEVTEGDLVAVPR